MMGGAGERFGGEKPKQFLGIEHRGEHKALFEITAEKLLAGLPLDIVIFVLPKDAAGKAVAEPVIDRLKQKFPGRKMQYAAGGATRFVSFLNGLAALRRFPEAQRVLVHDANRPYLNREYLARVEAHLAYLSADLPAFIPVTPVVDSVVRLSARDPKTGRDGKNVLAYENRNELRRVQTPQLLHLETFYAAFDAAQGRNGFASDYTDEGSFCLSLGLSVGTFEGDLENTKITFLADLNEGKL